MTLPVLETLSSSVGSNGVAVVELNRPGKSNALNTAMFRELPLAMAALDNMSEVRVVILKGSGRHFCAGIDLESLAGMMQNREGQPGYCPGREREKSRRDIHVMQAAFSSMEQCRKPVLAAIHGACIGAGIDMTTACDMRYCSQDAKFSVKEVDLAITADLGTLQRLPQIVGEGTARELALTGRTFDASEACRIGLIQAVYPSRESLLEGVMTIAAIIAAKSPLAVQGTKRVMLHSRDHSVADGLEYVATWNSAMLISTDIREVLKASSEKRVPQFSKL
eukprot:TRINITY_DN2534_c0_g1_i1.p1 TRINITY_DN2534_c0_g1~~TRINITY_DN2534_c0_g1_i1.p1  ORF type:complete len:279 (+),score=31.39 TRINITY_DN2534_c0_g1_i1:350-1186(+)